MLGLASSSAQNPQLSIESLPGTHQIQLGWPDGFSTFVVDQAASLAPGFRWVELNQTPTDANGRKIVVITPGPTQQYFRLRGAAAQGFDTILRTSPANGESAVSVNRETVIEFAVPLASNTVIDTTRFHADFGSRKILSRVELSGDRRRATLFYMEPLPAAARIRVQFAGDSLTDTNGIALDADDDGFAGGTRVIEFTTMSTTGIAGTAVEGRVFASDPVPVAGGGFANRPLEGVWITVDGAEEKLRVSTDANGYFLLEPCPAGDFFVHIDGRLAPESNWPDGQYYPFVGKTFTANVGRTNTAVGTGNIYLPLIAEGTLQNVSSSEPTTITFPASVLAENPALDGVSITVPPNTLFSDDGSRGGKVGIAPVPPDRIPSPLPAGLEFPLVFTIQTDGPSNFDQPVAVRFPNLPQPSGENLAPGAKSSLWSYNHDTGRWEVQGSMTVSADGKFLDTDPGVGVRQPGWHAANPLSSGDGGGGDDKDDPCASQKEAAQNALFGCALSALQAALDLAPPLGCAISLSSSIISAYMDCGNPAVSCWGSIAYNGFYGVTGCLGPVGSFTSAVKCLWELESAMGNLEECYILTSPVPPPRERFVQAQAAVAAGPFAQSDQLFSQVIDLDTAVLGDERWIDASASDPVNTQAFANALIADLGNGSDSGARISATERAGLMALASPAGLPTEARTALIDRFDRFATSGFTADEEKAVTDAGIALTATANELQALGWTSIMTGIVEGLQQLSELENARIGDRDVVKRRLYYQLVDQQTGAVRLGRVNDAGEITALPLVANRDYQINYLDPKTLRIGSTFFNAPGTFAPIPKTILAPFTGPDTDMDGLSDTAESIVGTNPAKADTDGDGLSDFAELQQDENPLDGLSLPLGVVANVPLSGRAMGIDMHGSLAFLATGDYGLAVVDVSRPLQPVKLSEIDLPGNNIDVAYSESPQVAAVVARADRFLPGDSGFLHFVDLSDPGQLRLIRTWPLDAVDVADANGLFYVAVDRQVRIYEAASGLELGWFATDDSVIGLTVAQERVFVATRSGLEIHSAGLTNPELLGKWAKSLAPPDLLGRSHLILDGSILFVAKQQGILTLDVSDTSTPKLIAEQTNNSPSLRSIALTGSGRLAGLLNLSSGGNNSSAKTRFGLFDVNDPSSLNTLLFPLEIVGLGQDLLVNFGLAFVADDSAGLTVMNFNNPDVANQAPVIAFDDVGIDADSVTPGVQVRQGDVLRLYPRITDDVQLQRAELLVNGEQVDSTAGFPVEFTWTVPAAGAVTLQIQGVDRSGNTATSTPLGVQVVPDVNAPTLIASSPSPNGAMFTGDPLLFFWNDSPSGSLDGTRVSLVNLGGDFTPGGGDDVAIPLNAALVSGGALTLSPAAELAPGKYSVNLMAGAVRDQAGNISTQDISFTFDVHEGTSSAVWISDVDGQFDDPANWLHNRVPDREDVLIRRFGQNPVVTIDSLRILNSLTSDLPLMIVNRANVRAQLGWHANAPVTISGGNLTIEGPAIFEEALTLSSGALTVSSNLETKASVTFSRGGSLTFNGPNAQFTAGGTVEGVDMSILVSGGAVIDLPMFVNYNGPGDFSSLFPVGSSFRAQGFNSKLTLSGLVSVTGPTNWNFRGVPSVTLAAVSGGELQLPKLQTLTGRTILQASGDSKLVAPSLTSVSGPDTNFPSQINVNGRSQLDLAAPLSLTLCRVAVDSEGAIHGTTLEVDETSSVEGSGTIVADIVNAGSIFLRSVNGNLVIDGALQLKPTSLLESTIGLGLDQTFAGRMDVRKAVTLDGAFRLALAKNYVPAVGDEFQTAIFTAMPAGTFATISSTALGAGLKAEVNVTTTDMKVTISSDP